MSQGACEGIHDGIATFCQHAVSLGDADFFVCDMLRQEFRNHELLTWCSCNSPKDFATEHIQLFWNGHLHAHSLGGRPGCPLDRIVIGKYLLARFAVRSGHIRNLHPGIHRYPLFRIMIVLRTNSAQPVRPQLSHHGYSPESRRRDSRRP